jgi:opacity protein-like surface antigen
MRFLAVVGIAGACLAASPLYAADLFDSAPPPMDANADQTELGSNWYIRGDVGYSDINQATVVPNAGLFPTITNAPIGDASSPVNAIRGNNQTTMSPDFSLGFGYRVNDWFRVDGTWQFSKGPGLGAQQTVYCPEVANAVSNYNTQTVNGVTSIVAVPVGYQYDYTQCDGKLNMTQYNNTGMIMGYFDVGHWGIFSPYVGAGVGINANTVQGHLTFNQQDTGATYGGPSVAGTAPAVWVDQTGVQNGNPFYTIKPGVNPSSGVYQPIGPANWNRTISSTKYSFAGAVAAGLGIKISESATLDLGYKLMTYDITGGVKSSLQSLNLGVRYNLN